MFALGYGSGLVNLLPTCCHLWGRDDDASQYAIKSCDREGTQSLPKRREPPQTLPSEFCFSMQLLALMHSLNYATLALLSGKEANTQSHNRTDTVGQTIKALDGLENCGIHQCHPTPIPLDPSLGTSKWQRRPLLHNSDEGLKGRSRRTHCSKTQVIKTTG